MNAQLLLPKTKTNGRKAKSSKQRGSPQSMSNEHTILVGKRFIYIYIYIYLSILVPSSMFDCPEQNQTAPRKNQHGDDVILRSSHQHSDDVIMVITSAQ